MHDLKIGYVLMMTKRHEAVVEAVVEKFLEGEANADPNEVILLHPEDGDDDDRKENINGEKVEEGTGGRWTGFFTAGAVGLVVVFSREVIARESEDQASKIEK